MDWKGVWINQYRSTVEITDDADHKIVGTFRTALDDSGFRDQDIRVFGAHHGDCISFAGAGKTPAGDAVVSFTGLCRDGKLETMWHLAADAAIVASAGEPGRIEKLKWWRSMTTGADTFQRI